MSAACLLTRSHPLPKRHQGKHHVPGLAFGWGHATCIQYLLLPTFSLAQGQWPGPAPGLIQLIPKAPHTEQPVGLQRSGETSRKFTASGYLQGILPPITTALLHSFSRLLQVSGIHRDFSLSKPSPGYSCPLHLWPLGSQERLIPSPDPTSTQRPF